MRVQLCSYLFTSIISAQGVCRHCLNVLGQQAHEVAGCVGVEAERRDDDVGGGVSPVLVVVLHPVQHRVSHCGLCMNHLTFREKMKRQRLLLSSS